MEAAALSYLVYGSAGVAAAAGIYGLLTSRTIMRLLVSIELLFNSVVLAAAFTGFMLSAGPGFYSLLIAVIVLTIVEMAVIVALVVLLFRRKQSLELDALKEVGG
ncbi:MAG: NADH-quinone oxidoreductase subunit K [Thermoproteota archaeon]